jgi:hypothetical protein
MSIEILRRQNPWWAEIAVVNDDPHLAEYDQAVVKWEPSPLHTLKLDRDLIYILLGPRQVGKTTFFKLLIRQLLLERNVHPRTILYLNCEALGPQTPQELAELLREYIIWAKTFSKDRLMGSALQIEKPGRIFARPALIQTSLFCGPFFVPLLSELGLRI